MTKTEILGKLKTNLPANKRNELLRIYNIMEKLTGPQETLLEKINLYKYIKNNTGVFTYNDMKTICDFKSFDGSFNALLHKGYLKHFITTDNFANKFILTKTN